MSGPKGYKWEVSAAELERRAAIENARAICVRVREEAVAAAAEATSFGMRRVEVAAVPRIADSATAGAATRTAEKYRQSVAHVLEQRDTARRAVVESAFAGGVRTLAPLHIALSSDFARASPSTAAGFATPSTSAAAVSDTHSLEQLRVDIREATKALATDLAEVRDDAVRERWVVEATTLLASETASSVSRLRDILLAVRAALRAQRQVDHVRAEAEELSLSIADISSTAGEIARAALAAAADRAALQNAARQARLARAEWAEQAARRYVVEQTIAALVELGHVVDDSFAVAAQAGEFAVARREEGDRYGVKLRFLPETETLLVNTVAFDRATATADDIAAEQRMCDDLDSVSGRLAPAGVTLTRTHGRLPGAVPVERHLVTSTGVAATHTDTASTTKTKRATRQQRATDR
ncbi:hypothetical protein [Microbacterium lacticum]